jgi:DNA-binding response OmpR family regulator
VVVRPYQPRVCVVDDDQHFIKLCRAVLFTEGFEVEAIDDVATAVESIAATLPDVALVDIRFHGEVAGLEVIRRLRASRGSASATPVVLCTASRDLLITHSALVEVLNCTVVEKPFEIDDLVGALRAAMARGPQRVASSPACDPGSHNDLLQ